jgi:hypothetical protein
MKVNNICSTNKLIRGAFGWDFTCFAFAKSQQPNQRGWLSSKPTAKCSFFVRRCHTHYCAASSPPSARPSNRHTDDDRRRGSYATTLEAGPGRAQDSPRRPARSKIRQDGYPLHGDVHYTTTHNLELCGMIVSRLPLVYKRRRRSPGRGGTNSGTLARFPPSP